MKTMTVFEARNHFARTLEAAKKDVVIVTRNGRPVAAIQAIDDDDVEDLLLERSERFWAMIARARRGRRRRGPKGAARGMCPHARARGVRDGAFRGDVAGPSRSAARPVGGPGRGWRRKVAGDDWRCGQGK